MRALLTNDDGIDAYGLALLADLAAPFCDEIVIVAPSGNRSGKGQALTLDEDIIFTEIAENRYSCSGTPVDCVLLAMNRLYKDGLPDILLSGINHGMNAADDVGYSGTIGAAKEAAIWGVRSIAFSQRSGKSEADFEPARTAGSMILEHALEQPWQGRTVLNVNFPSAREGAVKGMLAGPLDHHKLADVVLDGHTTDSYRIGPMHMRQDTDAGSDRAILDAGYASMTPIKLDSTDRALLTSLNPLTL